MAKRKVLFIGDAACDSGFARGTHNYLEALLPTWDVVVLGLNYRGDQHPYPYHIYPAWSGGDLFGIRHIHHVMGIEKPDLVIIQNDPWNIPAYMKQFDRLKHRPVMMGVIAVDGLNCRGWALKGLDHVVFWTEFARREAVKGGWDGSSSVVPLGVDLKTYYPSEDKVAARQALGLPDFTHNGWIVLNVNRNQPRKRLDLSLRYFAEWYHSRAAHQNSYLYLHVAPTGDMGYDCDQLSAYYGLQGHVILAQPEVYHGSTEKELATTYHAANVVLSTTQGEGWGLTTLEAMACGIPTIVPDWAALGEWAKGAARLVECTQTSVNPNGVNVIGGVPGGNETVAELHKLFNDEELYNTTRGNGIRLAARPEFRWEHIGARFAEEVEIAYGRAIDRRSRDAGEAPPTEGEVS